MKNPKTKSGWEEEQGGCQWQRCLDSFVRSVHFLHYRLRRRGARGGDQGYSRPLIAHINAALYSPHGASGLTVRLVAPTDAANLTCNVSPGASASAPSILIAPSNWITRMAAGLPPNKHYLMQGARYIATFSSFVDCVAAKELEFINRIFRPKDSPTTIHAYRLGHPGPVIDATLKWLRLGVHEWPDQDDYDDDGAEGKAWINDPERTQYLKARKVALEEASAEKSKGPSTR